MDKENRTSKTFVEKETPKHYRLFLRTQRGLQRVVDERVGREVDTQLTLPCFCSVPRGKTRVRVSYLGGRRTGEEKLTQKSTPLRHPRSLIGQDPRLSTQRLPPEHKLLDPL